MNKGQVKSSREEKIQQGFEFLRKLGTRDILFSGISGSVSYLPSEEDDVDIFIISERNRLWITLLRAFVIRILNRDGQICISLTMDDLGAHSMFTSQGDYLMASDSIHVIPYHGDGYYRTLMGDSPFIRRFYPEYADYQGQSGSERKFSRTGVMEAICFILLSSWLIIKEMLHNRRLENAGRNDDKFRTVIDPHTFYLDSNKYSELRQAAAEPIFEEQ